MNYRLIIIICFLLFGNRQLFSQEINTAFPDNTPVKFKVIYKNDSLHLRSESYVTYTATGKFWEMDPTQKEIFITYDYKKSDTIIFAKCANIGWVTGEMSGFYQDSDMIFIHPPRHNQFMPLEIAPFPTLELPLANGNKYGRLLRIGDGWGEFANTTIESRYSVTEELESNKGKIWKIHSESSSRKSESSPLKSICTLEMQFSQTEGYLRLEYNFTDRTQIIFFREN